MALRAFGLIRLTSKHDVFILWLLGWSDAW
jgi:hypothetical protein